MSCVLVGSNVADGTLSLQALPSTLTCPHAHGLDLFHFDMLASRRPDLARSDGLQSLGQGTRLQFAICTQFYIRM